MKPSFSFQRALRRVCLVGLLALSVSFTGTPTLAADLVGHWEMDEGSGTSAADSSGNSNTGTLSNGPAWTGGKIGQALDFDGVDDVVNCGSGSSLDNLSALTVAAWIKPDSMGEGGYERIVDKGTGSSSGFSFYVGRTAGNADQIAFRVDSSTADMIRFSATNGISTGTWLHVACDVDGIGHRHQYKVKCQWC